MYSISDTESFQSHHLGVARSQEIRIASFLSMHKLLKTKLLKTKKKNNFGWPTPGISLLNNNITTTFLSMFYEPSTV